MNDINLLAVLGASVVSFAFGALWYSPLLFMRPWAIAAGVDPEVPIDNPGRVYPITALVTLISVAAFAWFVGPDPSLPAALAGALIAGVGLIAASMAINYQFASRSVVHWMIDAGFHVVRLLLIGGTLALWP